jgi:hypothetical protein
MWLRPYHAKLARAAAELVKSAPTHTPRPPLDRAAATAMQQALMAQVRRVAQISFGDATTHDGEVSGAVFCAYQRLLLREALRFPSPENAQLVLSMFAATSLSHTSSPLRVR